MQLVRTMAAAAALVVGVALPAAAYIGPGAGLSLLGAFWGLLLAVVAALGFVIMWPLRRLFRRAKPPVETVSQHVRTEPAGAASQSRSTSL
jgi:membrane protein implicated in regulation of membrane protease activity